MSDDPNQGVPPDRFAPEPIVSEIGAIPDREYAPFNFSAENDKLIFEFSAAEFAKVLSALRNGAYMTYGDEGSSVYWSFLRNVDYPLAICEAVLACFVGDEDFRHAVIDAITSDSYFTQKMQTLIDNGSIVTTGGETIVATDDLAALFGAVTFLVDTMNNANVSLYAALELTENKSELGEILFEAVPILETLPIDEVSEYINTLREGVAEGYAAQYTLTPITGMRDRLRCGLFCLARGHENTLNWELVAQYFWDLFGYENDAPFEAFTDFVTFVLSGTWTGDEIVYLSFANIAAALTQTQKFSGMTFPSLSGIMKLGANNPDPDWETLCTDCPPPPPENCEDPAQFIKGNVTAQSGLEFTVEAVYDSGTGYRYIEWGNIDCEDEPCFGFEYEFLTGALNDAFILGAECTSVSLASLPQDVHYFYFRSIFAFSMKITFGA